MFEVPRRAIAEHKKELIVGGVAVLLAQIVPRALERLVDRPAATPEEPEVKPPELSDS